MQKSVGMVDIIAKNGTVVVGTGVVDDGTLRVSRKVSEYKTGEPMATAVLLAAAEKISQINESAPGARITVILPEHVLIRAAEAQKLKNAGVADIGARLLKGWMVDRSKVSEVEAAAWTKATTMFGSAVTAYSGTIVWQNARELYRYTVVGEEPDGSDLVDLAGKEYTFTTGVNVENKLRVVNSRGDTINYSHTGLLSTVTITNRDGKKRWIGSVPRMITIVNDDGTKGTVTAYEASDINLAVEGSTASATAVINALRLHVKTAERLPKLAVARKIVIVEDE